MQVSSTKKSPCLALPEVFYANLPDSSFVGRTAQHCSQYNRRSRHCTNINGDSNCFGSNSPRNHYYPNILQGHYPHMEALDESIAIHYLPNRDYDVDEDDADQELEGVQNTSSHQTTQQHSANSSTIKPKATSNNNGDSSVNFEFCCQLAEGSPMHSVSNFSSMIELYEKIAQCFNISPKEIMYCTLNTAKLDLDQILGGQIGLEDIIYVHRKGERKHVEVKKSEKFLGLTIADNGNGCSYIKKIKQDSTASRVPFIKMGDHIESIMEQSMVGCRHFEVAHFLKNIPLDSIFTITLIEPFSSGFQQLSPRKQNCSPNNLETMMNGKGTLRIRDSRMVDQDSPSNQKIQTGLSYINRQLEKFIGINDDELAEELWRLAEDKNPHDFALSIEQSDLNDFKFSKDFIFDVWAIVDDVANQRLTCK